MNKQWKLTVGAAALAASFGAQAGIVDLFSTTQANLYDTTSGTDAYAQGLFSQAGAAADTTILGGYRDLWVSALSGADNTAGSETGSKIGVSSGQLRFSNDTGVTGVGEVQWDGNDNSSAIATSGLGGIDLTLGGSVNAFEVTTIFSDQNWVFEITMYTDATNWTKVSLDANSVGPGGTYGSPHISYIPFSAFTNNLLCGSYGAAPGVNAITCSGAGANDTSLGALVARLNTGDATASQNPTISIDLQLDGIRTVPEPGVLALMGMGLMAAGFASRRRKSQA